MHDRIAYYQLKSRLEGLDMLNSIYNKLHLTNDVNDTIGVYFDNQIGLIEKI